MKVLDKNGVAKLCANIKSIITNEIKNRPKVIKNEGDYNLLNSFFKTNPSNNDSSQTKGFTMTTTSEKIDDDTSCYQNVYWKCDVGDRFVNEKEGLVFECISSYINPVSGKYRHSKTFEYKYQYKKNFNDYRKRKIIFDGILYFISSDISMQIDPVSHDYDETASLYSQSNMIYPVMQSFYGNVSYTTYGYNLYQWMSKSTKNVLMGADDWSGITQKRNSAEFILSLDFKFVFGIQAVPTYSSEIKDDMVNADFIGVFTSNINLTLHKYIKYNEGVKYESSYESIRTPNSGFFNCSIPYDTEIAVAYLEKQTSPDSDTPISGVILTLNTATIQNCSPVLLRVECLNIDELERI